MAVETQDDLAREYAAQQGASAESQNDLAAEYEQQQQQPKQDFFTIPSVGLGAKKPIAPSVSDTQKAEARASLGQQYKQEIVGQGRQLAKVGAAVAPELAASEGVLTQMLVSGLSGAAQSKLGGGSGKEAATTAVLSAAVPPLLKGTLAGVGGAYRSISKALSSEQVRTALQKALGTVESGAQEATASSAATLKQNTDAIQSELQQHLRNMVSDVAKENGVTPSSAASIRDVLEETGDQIITKSKSQFAKLDEATGADFKGTMDRIKRLDARIAEEADVNPDMEGKLIETRNVIQDKLDQMFEDAKAAGLDVDEPRKNWKTASALYDADRQLNMSTSGMRKGVDASRIHTPENVDPQKFSNRLEKLYKQGRLQDAIGDERADELLSKADSAHAQNEAEKAAHEARTQAIKESAAKRSESIKAEAEKQLRKIETRKKVGLTLGTLGAGAAGEEAIRAVVKSH